LLAFFLVVGTLTSGQTVLSKDVAVVVEDFESGVPLKDAEVCLTQGALFKACKFTDNDGSVKFQQDCRSDVALMSNFPVSPILVPL